MRDEVQQLALLKDVDEINSRTISDSLINTYSIELSAFDEESFHRVVANAFDDSDNY